MTDLITDAMVETAAKARWDYGREDAGDMTEWEMRHPAFREADLLTMRAALEAVAPLIAAKALRDAADAWQTGEWSDSMPHGASRPALILGMAQRATNWLRARANRIERGES